MKLLGILVLLAAGGILLTIAVRAGEPDYVPPEVDRDPPVVPTELSGPAPPGFVVRAYDVEGMCCSGCSGKIYASLTRIEGVEEASVDFVLGTAAVVVPEDLDAARIEPALNFGKYTASPRP